ncbi:MAG: helix-turn-helix transcriptional regulator [Anaerolineales bacterium]|nr:helix-turn-helix transcriptional regulator [Anaerolineales bacterium]
MAKPKVGKPSGILNPKASQQKFELSRHAPSQDLAFFVAHYWIVRWDLRGQEPYLSETLPHPSIHLVFEKDNTRIVGIMTGKFSRLLEGQGQVLGIKFRPGAFYPFVKRPMAQFTNRTFRVEDIFGADSQPPEAAILTLDDEARMVELAEQFIRRRVPERDETVELINAIMDWIKANPAITRVDEVVSRFSMSKRTLQRLFNQYVGVSPKWVIQRYRLHEAADHLGEGEVADWAQLALKLGYFDQAHFIKDFKTIVGKSPAEYVKAVETTH